jgi:hypothetical protein
LQHKNKLWRPPKINLKLLEPKNGSKANLLSGSHQHLGGA